MPRKPTVTAYELLADQQPGRTAVAHRLSEASIAAWANDALLAVEMVKLADGVRHTLGLEWDEMLGVAVYSPLAATTTATATAE